MIAFNPGVGNLLNGSRTTAGTILTIPAGGVWCGDLMLSASAAVAVTATPNVTVSGAGSEPATGSTVARLSLSGLALTTVAGAATVACILVAPAGNSITLEFALGGATSASVVANGFLM